MSQDISADLPVLLDSFLLHLRAERKSTQTVKTYTDGVRAFLLVRRCWPAPGAGPAHRRQVHHRAARRRR